LRQDLAQAIGLVKSLFTPGLPAQREQNVDQGLQLLAHTRLRAAPDHLAEANDQLT
jgi:hypothetical protein